ncbi:MAG: hypothetical protein IT203_06705 [Fimbriimonadaceae bacterium]|nr:hypothetical protein [Fimbriimonadaceae bacterium]
MLALIGALAISLSAPDTSLRLKIGDQWAIERTKVFRSSEDTLTQVESLSYSVSKEDGKVFLRAECKLKETRTPEGDVVPAPKQTRAIVSKVTLDGNEAIGPQGESVDEHRIERFLAIERSGSLSEPLFFPVPPNVRLVGLQRATGFSKAMGFSSNLQELGGDKSMRGSASFQLDSVSGILTKGTWHIQNAPMPGSDGTWDLDVAVELKTMKLAPRA